MSGLAGAGALWLIAQFPAPLWGALPPAYLYETHRSSGYRLGRCWEVCLADHSDHRVTAGGRVVGEEDHRASVGRHLDRAQDHSLAGEFACELPLQ